jgi:hypothetical protein
VFIPTSPVAGSGLGMTPWVRRTRRLRRSGFIVRVVAERAGGVGEPERAGSLEDARCQLSLSLFSVCHHGSRRKCSSGCSTGRGLGHIATRKAESQQPCENSTNPRPISPPGFVELRFCVRCGGEDITGVEDRRHG